MPFLRSTLGLLRATHPLPAFAVTLLVSAVAASRGARGLELAWIALSTAAGQASVGWSNDYLDRHRDRAAGRGDKPLVEGVVGERTVLIGALLAFPLSFTLSLSLGFPEAGVMLVAVGSAWLYNTALKSTVLSWLPYAISFGLVPVYIWQATTDTQPPLWLVAATSLLGVAAHFLNALPDLETDRATSVRGLPHVLGLKGSLFLACALLGAVLVLVLAGTAPVIEAQVVAGAIAALMIASVAWAGTSGRARVGFRLTIVAAAAIVAAFLLSPVASQL